MTARIHRQDPVRVGIDFGNTIGTIETGPAPHAFTMIAHIVSKFDPENVFIVSRAGPNMETKIRAFLEATEFYPICGFLRQNVIFVRECAEKAFVVQEHGISIFLDDHIKLVRSLVALPTVHRVFWMHADTRELHMIEKPYRHKIAITSSWAKTMKLFQRIPSHRNKNN